MGNFAKLEKIRRGSSRRVKVAIRRLCNQQLSTKQVLSGAQALRKAIQQGTPMNNAVMVHGPDSPESLAWAEIQTWYERCITAAPKPDVRRDHVNIGHVIRWCEQWDISTKDIEAICAKHNAFQSIRPFAVPFPQ